MLVIFMKDIYSIKRKTYKVKIGMSFTIVNVIDEVLIVLWQGSIIRE